MDLDEAREMVAKIEVDKQGLINYVECECSGRRGEGGYSTFRCSFYWHPFHLIQSSTTRCPHDDDRRSRNGVN